jgi:cytochrome b561
MRPVDPGAERYDALTIFFHWATAAFVVLQFVGAWTIDVFPSGALRVGARSFHITAGAVLAALVLARLAWRATRGRRLPLADEGVMNVASKATHWGLYALLLAMVSVGFLLAWVRGDNLWNVFTIPAFDAANRALRHDVQEMHASIGWFIIVVVGLHAGAALFHRYFWHDGVLARMLRATAPSRPAPGPEAAGGAASLPHASRS